MTTEIESHETPAADDDMPEEIDFAQGTRGKFYRPDSSLRLPTDGDDQAPTPTAPAETFVTDDPAFGMWRDREDMADVAAYLGRIRASRFNRDGSRKKP